MKRLTQIRALRKAELPDGSSVEVLTSLAMKLKIFDLFRMENQSERRGSAPERGGASPCVLAWRYSCSQNEPAGPWSISAT